MLNEIVLKTHYYGRNANLIKLLLFASDLLSFSYFQGIYF